MKGIRELVQPAENEIPTLAVNSEAILFKRTELTLYRCTVCDRMFGATEDSEMQIHAEEHIFERGVGRC